MGKKRNPQRPRVFAYGDVNKYIVDPVTGCWLWQGAFRISRGGGRYGVLRDPRPGPKRHRLIPAHVFFLEMEMREEVPEGMHVDHAVCDNTLCVNPAHLQVAEALDNSRRGTDKQWGKGRYAANPQPQPETAVPF